MANILPNNLLSDLTQVRHFKEAATFVKPEDLKDMVHVSADLQQHAEFIRQYLPLGFDKIFLHNVNVNQEIFIQDFGAKVLPLLV